MENISLEKISYNNELPVLFFTRELFQEETMIIVQNISEIFFNYALVSKSQFES